jgi:hypothetical protein
MAETSGIVQRLKWLPPSRILLVAIGPTPTAVQLFLLTFDTTDDADLARKKAVAHLLGGAFAAGLPVSLFHNVNDAIITGADVRFASIRVDGVEVTQSIQDLNHSVPLIALKSTVVRLYLSSRLAATVTVRGTLWIRRASGGASRTIASLNAAILDPTQFGQVDAQRRQAAKSLNFALPPDMATAGDLIILLSALTDAASTQPLDFAPPGDLATVSFIDSPPLRLRLIGFPYDMGTPAVTHTPRSLDFGLTFSWLQRAYPVALVLGSQTIVPANAAPPFGCGDINAKVAALRALDMSAGADARTHYYGLVSDDGFFMRGCSAVPSTPDPAAVGSGPAGSATWGWDFDGSYADWYAGHEIGHTFGRRHPGFCGESHDDPSYPFVGGQLSNADDAYVGFDVGDATFGLPMTALPGTDWHDVMTYCSTQWLSSYTYTGIRTRLVAEDALGPGGGGSGRPDERFPPGFEQPGATTKRTLVSIIAEVNVARGTGRIAYVLPVTRARVTPVDPDSAVTIRTRDGRGQMLDEWKVPVKPFAEEAPEDAGHALCDAIMALHPDAAAIELYVKGQLVDTLRSATSSPSVRDVRVRAFDARGLVLGWDGDASQDPRHSYNVQLSDDNGRSWRTVAVGVMDRQITIHPDNVPRDRRVLFRVQATDGFRSTEAVVDWSAPGSP